MSESAAREIVTETSLAAVVMAAGLGTRMRSATPKHLHPILGRRMVDWVLEAARPLSPSRLVVVVSPGAADQFGELDVAVQQKPLGTGDAVRSARSALAVAFVASASLRTRAAQTNHIIEDGIMTDQQGSTSKLPDPVELSQAMARIAEQSQRLVVDFMQFWMSKAGYQPWVDGFAQADLWTPSGKLLISGVNVPDKYTKVLDSIKPVGNAEAAPNGFLTFYGGYGKLWQTESQNMVKGILDGTVAPAEA